MNTELLVKNIFEIDFNNLSKEELEIHSLKLYLYSNEIEDLKNKEIIRLISLQELKNEKKIPRINRLTIDDETNNLSLTLFNLLNQINAINIERNSILTNILANIEWKNKILQERYEEVLLQERYSQTFKLYNYISSNNIDIENNKSKIAYMERELELYAYKNKDKISDLDKKLDLIDKEDKNISNREYLLNKLEKLEIEYEIFELFGKNIITEEQLYKLYKNKFYILKSDVNFSFFYIERDNKYQYYYAIIQEKLEKIISGENEIIKYVFKDDYEETLKNIIELMQDDNKEYDITNILIKNYKLNVLLAFDKKDGYDHFLNELKMFLPIFEVGKKYANPSYENIWNFYEKHNNDRLISALTNKPYSSSGLIISLRDSLEMSYVHKKNRLSESILNEFKEAYSKYLQLYKIYRKYNMDENYYKFPEGIVTLKKNSYSEFFIDPREGYEEEIDIILDNLLTISKNKIIIMPSTLRKIEGNIFSGYNIKGLELNDGLEKIICDGINHQVGGFTDLVSAMNGVTKDKSTIYYRDEITYIRIPASLKNIRFNDYDKKEIETIKFADYKNSIILNDKEKLCNALKPFLEVSYSIYTEDEVHIYYIPNIQITLDEIILNNDITIKGYELDIKTKTKIKFTQTNPRNESLEEDIINNYTTDFIDNFYKVIEKKTGYSFKEKKDNIKVKKLVK